MMQAIKKSILKDFNSRLQAEVVGGKKQEIEISNVDILDKKNDVQGTLDQLEIEFKEYEEDSQSSSSSEGGDEESKSEIRTNAVTSKSIVKILEGFER